MSVTFCYKGGKPVISEMIFFENATELELSETMINVRGVIQWVTEA